MALEPLCALVRRSRRPGKSNLLAALRAVLDPAVAPEPAHWLRGGSGEIALQATLEQGGRVRLAGIPPAMERSGLATPPPVLYLPATLRAGALVAASASPAAEILRRTAADRSPAQPAIIKALDACCEGGLGGVVLLVEEPELYLRPQGQRYL